MNIITSIRNRVFGKPETNIIEYVKVRDVKSPVRGTSLSAGLDFYVPNDYNTVTIEPNKSVLIPSGIHVKMDPEYVLIAFNKSGVASKKSLVIGAQVIDADYEGEVHINLHNVGSETQTLNPGDKVTQFILLKTNLANPVEYFNLESLYSESKSERDTNGFGSTGNN